MGLFIFLFFFFLRCQAQSSLGILFFLFLLPSLLSDLSVFASFALFRFQLKCLLLLKYSPTTLCPTSRFVFLHSFNCIKNIFFPCLHIQFTCFHCASHQTIRSMKTRMFSASSVMIYSALEECSECRRLSLNTCYRKKMRKKNQFQEPLFSPYHLSFFTSLLSVVQNFLFFISLFVPHKGSPET